MRHDTLKTASNIAPITLRVSEACRATGIGRSKLYELINSGDIEVIKIGRMTLIPMASLETLVAEGRLGKHASKNGAQRKPCLHPFLADAIITAAVAATNDEVRQTLLSSNELERFKAEDSLVTRIIDALYPPD